MTIRRLFLSLAGDETRTYRGTKNNLKHTKIQDHVSQDH